MDTPLRNVSYKLGRLRLPDGWTLSSPSYISKSLANDFRLRRLNDLAWSNFDEMSRIESVIKAAIPFSVRR